jgi:hypothetical protein
MPKIIVLVDDPGEYPARMTLSERVVANHLLDSHYANQLLERVSWAAADAEALELRSLGDRA